MTRYGKRQHRYTEGAVATCGPGKRPIGRLVVLLLASMPLAARADEAKQLSYGRHLARECTSCHRLDGVDNSIPAIVGMAKGDFTTTLGFYRGGQRTNAAMVSVAQSLDDAQVAALAAWYASLPKPAPPPKR